MNGDAAIPKRIDTYAVYESFARGGMASAHYGLHLRPGFSRPVALKRLHPQLAAEADFVRSFLEEARLAARVRHPNVVPTLDVVSADGEVLLVMEYVAGEALSSLLRVAHERGSPVPLAVTASIILGALEGLHAAHEAVDELGRPLHLVHRDVSPQNVLVGLDGVARVLDFGIAKAATSLDTTREGQIKGKLAYMAPEQLSHSEAASRATDIYAVGVVLWEMITLRRMFANDVPAVITAKVASGIIEPPSRYVEVSTELEAVVMRALALDPSHRFASAREMSAALSEVLSPASNSVVGAWVEDLSGAALRVRSRRLAEIERTQASELPPHPRVAAPPIVTATLPMMTSGVSGTVVLAGGRPRRSTTSRATLLSVGLLAALLVVIGGGVAMRRRPQPAPEIAPTELPPVLGAPGLTSASSVATTEPPPPTLISSGSSGAVTSTSAPSGTATHATTGSRRGGRPIASSRPKADPCDPPWTIDADGLRQYKKGCFR